MNINTRNSSIREELATIRVLVVDDHPVVRLGLVGLLDIHPDIEVIAEADSCVQACALAERLRPDVILLDLELTDATGAEALNRLRNVVPATPIVVLTAHDNDWRVVEAIQTGLEAFLVKGAPPESICQAIRVVNSGGYYLDPQVTSKVLGQVGRKVERRQGARSSLTSREQTVLQMLAEGKRNKEIADSLFISERTVKYHISALFTRLKASNRTQAVKNAVEQGLMHP
jgi:DNA-binding NarL/FixJ family response regulator